MSTPIASDMLIQLARRDLSEGQLDSAQARCRQVLDAYPRHPGALDILGTVRHAQGRYQEAVEAFDVLTQIQPTAPVHWEHLGTALRAIKRYDQALEAFARALRLGPPSVGLLYNLGALQMDRCDLRASYLALRDAVALQPRNALIRWALAQCCCDLALRDEAVETVQEWQQFEGLSTDLLVKIALLLIATGGARFAQPAVQRLLAHPPQSGRAALGFAALLERMHRLEEARAVMLQLDRDDRSVDGDLDKPLMWAVLADRAGDHEQAYQHLAAALKVHVEPLRRHRLLFPLAKACDALGRHEEAFAAAEEAHRSQLQFITHATGSSAAPRSQVWTLAENACRADDVAAWGTEGPVSAVSPVFVVGFPRSGTTLLEQVLDAHPMLVSMDEQGCLASAAREVGSQGFRYPAELGKLDTRAIDAVRAQYWARVGTHVRLEPGQRLIDKNPTNMVLLPLIKRLFPHADIILTIRHPCDTVLSCFMQHFLGDLALLCCDLGTLSRAYSAAFTFWYAQSQLLQPRSCELRYEELVANFTGEVRRLSDFLRLPWHDGMLAPGEHARTRGFITTPSYAQVLQPVSNRYVGRWKAYAAHFREVMPILAPWIERWGYSVD